jgi:hypothetical protein
MSATGQVRLPPLPASIDNPEAWEEIAQEITRGTGLPLTVTPDVVLAMIGSAVPLMFEAQGAGDAGLLRGTFADPVVAQCQRIGVCLLSGQPTSTVVHLVGSRVVDGHGVMRVHVIIQGKTAAGEATVDRHFWDLQLDGEVTAGQTTCPNCGGPIAQGELICDHSHTDVRSTVDVPLVVSRLELY